jgi:hypothetical protein
MWGRWNKTACQWPIGCQPSQRPKQSVKSSRCLMIEISVGLAAKTRWCLQLFLSDRL